MLRFSNMNTLYIFRSLMRGVSEGRIHIFCSLPYTAFFVKASTFGAFGCKSFPFLGKKGNYYTNLITHLPESAPFSQ